MSLEACWSLLSCSEPISYEPLLHTHKCEHLTRPAGLFFLSSGVINIQQCIHAHGRGLCWSQRCSQSAEALRGRAGMWTNKFSQLLFPLLLLLHYAPMAEERSVYYFSPCNSSSLSHFFHLSFLATVLSSHLHFTLFVQLCDFSKSPPPIVVSLLSLRTSPHHPLPSSFYLGGEILMQGKWHQ